MFIRQKRNKSGSFGIQILLKEKAKQEDDRFKGQVSLFVFEKDVQNESFISELYNAQIRTI
jgi:hypothetical protein